MRHSYKPSFVFDSYLSVTDFTIGTCEVDQDKINTATSCCGLGLHGLQSRL